MFKINTFKKETNERKNMDNVLKFNNMWIHSNNEVNKTK
jgi:hypothetical protein